MAEPSGDRLLLYLLDMAIIEANGRYRKNNDHLERTDPEVMVSNRGNTEPTPEVKII